MKKKDKLRNFLIVFSILILLGLVFYFQTSQSTITGPNGYIYPIQNESITFKGVEIDLESVYFGSLATRSESSPLGGTLEVCDDGNEGETRLSNSYSISSNTLILQSSMYGEYKQCDNYIELNGIFPKGTLEVTCELSASAGRGSYNNIASCNIDGETSKCRVSEGSNNDCGGITSTSKTFTKTIETDGDEIKIRASTTTDGGGDPSSANTNIDIDFTPELIEETNEEPNIKQDPPKETNEESQEETKGFSGFLNNLTEWFNNLWEKIF